MGFPELFADATTAACYFSGRLQLIEKRSTPKRTIMRPFITHLAVSLLFFLLLPMCVLKAQQTYPEAAFNQSYVPSSPNGAAWAAYGDQPVSLYEGTPVISIPVYTVKCGALSLPISLSYNYNGFFPLQDAGWVGLGWNLNAGGIITRQVEGGVDNSENSGYNYGQYNIADSVTGSPDSDNFWGSAYNNLLGNAGKSYDLAPDIYDAEFNGYSDKFLWVSGKAYMMTWDKDFGVSWPSPTSNHYVLLPQTVRSIVLLRAIRLQIIIMVEQIPRIRATPPPGI